ncbi:MAG: twin-arginine translocase subunit TatC, partial [Halobacteria archaeon]|nr:twin-arginine translocase subunit TatC [Halobacteria archaeon]
AFYRGAVEVASSARKEGIKILVAFLLGLLSAILVLRMYAFEAITRQTLRLARGAGYAVETSYINPFEVVLLQAKIGIFVGVLFAVPAVIYSARDSLRKRGYWVDAEWTSRGRVTGFVVGAVALFFGGIAYAYFVMIPYILQFVSAIAVTADIKPFFRISSFVNFVLVYSLLFGLIAQLPFVMVFTVKSGMVSYRFYRYKWRYFVVVASVFAAIVTSPDPMTQLVVLGPMVVVYFVGLGVVRVAAREEIRMQERLEKEQDETGSAGAEGSTVEALRSVMSSGSEKESVDKSEVSDSEVGEVKRENT